MHSFFNFPNLYKFESAILHTLTYDNNNKISNYVNTNINLTIFKKIVNTELNYTTSGERLYDIYIKETNTKINEKDKLIINNEEYIIEEVSLIDSNLLINSIYQTKAYKKL